MTEVGQEGSVLGRFSDEGGSVTGVVGVAEFQDVNDT